MEEAKEGNRLNMIEADGDEIENPILPRMHLGVKYQHKYSWSELQSIVILVVSKLSKLL